MLAASVYEYNLISFTSSLKSTVRLTFSFNTKRPRLNGHHFADDLFKCTFLNENVLILIKISLKFVGKGLIFIVHTL